MANKIIITWDDSNINISAEAEKSLSQREAIGVLEYAKMMLYEDTQSKEE